MVHTHRSGGRVFRTFFTAFSATLYNNNNKSNIEQLFADWRLTLRLYQTSASCKQLPPIGFVSFSVTLKTSTFSSLFQLTFLILLYHSSKYFIYFKIYWTLFFLCGTPFKKLIFEYFPIYFFYFSTCKWRVVFFPRQSSWLLFGKLRLTVNIKFSSLVFALQIMLRHAALVACLKKTRNFSRLSNVFQFGCCFWQVGMYFYFCSSDLPPTSRKLRKYFSIIFVII